MTHRASRSTAAVAAWAALCAPAVARARGRATADAPPSGRIQQLIADEARLLALRDGQVLIFGPDGSRLGRCGPVPRPASRAPRPWAGAPDASETLRDAALPDDDSSLAAEELLEDEAEGAARPRARRGPEEPSMTPRALAASGPSAWVAASDGVYRVGAHGCARVALAGRDARAIAAGGRTLAVISGQELFTADLAGDRGAVDPSFRAAAALPPHPRLLAVDGRGTVLIADDAGVLSFDAAGEAHRVLEVRADALTACGQTVGALAANGVYLWGGERFSRVGGRPPARVLGCGDGPQRRWLAGGLGLWSSPDAAVWTEQRGWLGTTVAGVAAAAGRVWVVTEAGLAPVRMDDRSPVGPAPMVISPGEPARPTRRPSVWCWPTVTAALTVDWSWRSSGAWARRTTTAFLLVRFPFDRPPPPGGEITALALERTRRDADLARLELAADVAARGALDPIEADEMAAWRELAAAEREALR